MRIRTTIQGICREHMNFINPYNNYSLISFIGNGWGPHSKQKARVKISLRKQIDLLTDTSDR